MSSGLESGLLKGKHDSGMASGLVYGHRSSGLQNGLQGIQNGFFSNFYSITRSGNFTDRIWKRNGIGFNGVPPTGANIYVPKGMILTINQNAIITRLVSYGSVIFDNTARTFDCLGDYQIYGVLNMAGSGATAHNLILRGVNNFIEPTTFVTGTGSTITYGRNGYQNVLNLGYNLLTFLDGSKKFLPNNTFTINSIFQTAQNPFPNIIEKLNIGDLICIGHLRLGNGTQLNLGSNNLELRNGLRSQATNAFINCNNVIIATNNQSADFQAGFGVIITGNLLINNSITFTNNFGLSFAGLDVSGFINGSNASSTLINNGKLVLRTFNSLMTTGIFTNNIGSLIEIAYGGNNTIPNYTYYNLTISGSGIKSLGQDTTINTNLITSTLGQLDIGNFNLTVNGIATINNVSASTSIITSGTGVLLFIGELRGNNFSQINIGSNTIECRGGVRSNSSTTFIILSPVNLTTNNQNLSSANNGIGFALTFSNSLTLANDLTATITLNSYVIISGILNGSNSNSIVNNLGTFEYQNSTAPMVVGQLQCNNESNTFKYNRLGNQDVKGGTYRTIEFGGSGVKRLLANVIVNVTAGGSQSTTGSATIDLNGFTITTI